MTTNPKYVPHGRTRYAKMPRVGEMLFFNDHDCWPILAVHKTGEMIEARDRVGRVRRLTHAEKGVWLVARSVWS